jgi:hypothetical protein
VIGKVGVKPDERSIWPSSVPWGLLPNFNWQPDDVHATGTFSVEQGHSPRHGAHMVVHCGNVKAPSACVVLGNALATCC